VFPPLYAMRQGLRASMLPAINLAQMSEFSLVLIQVGVQSGQTTPGVAGAGSTAFIVLAVLSTFVMMNSDPITRGAIPILTRLGLSDLDHAAAEQHTATERKRRIILLGFYRVASSFLSELERRHAPLLEEVFVVHFHPAVYHHVQTRGVQVLYRALYHVLPTRGVEVLYGDIAHADTLAHSGMADAEIVISSLPDSLLKGTS